MLKEINDSILVQYFCYGDLCHVYPMIERAAIEQLSDFAK